MMEAKHTPGPWYTDETDEGTPGVWASPTGALVALVMRGADEDGNITWERTSWNDAALIAAAPELLQAVGLLLLDFDTEELGRDLNSDTIAAARAALAKAEAR